MEIRVINFRKGPFGNALAFFDVALDRTFVLRGCVFKAKRDAKAGSRNPADYYYQAPSKRREKNGVVQKNAEGFEIWDAHFDLYGEKVEGQYKITNEAFEARALVIEQALAQYLGEAQANAGRGGPKRGAAPKKVAAAVEEDLVDEAEDGDDIDDDDLPF